VVDFGNKVDLGSYDVVSVPNTFGGEYNFGRGQSEHDRIGDRINWAVIQAQSIDEYVQRNGFDYKSDYDDFWKRHTLKEFAQGGAMKMVERAIRKYAKPKRFSVDLSFDDFYDNDGEPNKFPYAYIDHQSMWHEYPENLLIFKDDETMEAFLFGVGSRIREGGEDGDEGEDAERYDAEGYFTTYCDHPSLEVKIKTKDGVDAVPAKWMDIFFAVKQRAVEQVLSITAEYQNEVIARAADKISVLKASDEGLVAATIADEVNDCLAIHFNRMVGRK
jgi:hypothetical protein